ncbi:hypothetical protein GW796_11470 [archaeon]|nr:hypothetical protein [archaeon]
MATKNKQIRSFYLDQAQIDILEEYGNGIMSVNKSLQEIIRGYMDKEFITPREMIINHMKKILLLVEALETNEKFKNIDREELINLTKQITQATEVIKTNLNKL